jgi:hypothetical protein
MLRHLPSILFAALLAVANRAPAQSNATAPQSPELNQLQQQKDRAQLEADIATAEKNRAEAETAAFKARLGGLTTSTLPQGTVKLDNVAAEASNIAYRAVAGSAKVIAQEISVNANQCPPKLIFFSSKDLDVLQSFDALNAQLALISSQSAGILEPVLLARVPKSVLSYPGAENLFTYEAPAQISFAPALAFAGVDAALGLIQLFKTDTELHGVAVTSDDLALQAMIARELKAQCASSNVIHPSYFYPPLSANSPLVKNLENLLTVQKQAAARYRKLSQYLQTPLTKAVEALKKSTEESTQVKSQKQNIEKRLNTKPPPTAKEKAELEAQLKKISARQAELQAQIQGQLNRDQYCTAQELAGNKCPTPPGDEDELMSRLLSDEARVEDRMEELKAINTRITELAAGLMKADSNGVTPFQSLLRAESLKAAPGGNASILMAKLVSVGGNNITKRNIFHTSLRFSGGAIAEFLFMDNSGSIAKSGVVSCYGGAFGEGDLRSLSVPAGAGICRSEKKAAEGEASRKKEGQKQTETQMK